jgi:hypothetical protein
MSTSFAGKSFRVACIGAAIFGFASIAQGEGVSNQLPMGTAGGMTDQLVYGNLGAGVERH